MTTPVAAVDGRQQARLPKVVEIPRPGFATAAPFVALMCLGVASVFLPPYDAGGVAPYLVAAVLGVALAFLGVSLSRSARSWVDPVGPWMFFLVIAMARDATGGATSGLGALVALPLVWLAMVGTRRDLRIGSGLTLLIFLAPIVILGPPVYPVEGWRPAAVWALFGLLVGPAIQSVVRRLAQERAKEHETGERLDAIMQGARLSSVVATDAQGVIRSFGVGAEDLLGYRSVDMVGLRTPLAYHDEAEVQAVAADLGVKPGFGVFAELARRNAPSMIWTYVRADGERLHVRQVMTELIGADGEIDGYLGVGIDTTAAVNAEKDLTRAESRWRVLLDHLPDLTVIMLDPEHRIGFVAGAGAARNDLRGRVGQHLSTILNQETLARLRPLIDQAFAGRESTVELMATGDGAEHEIVATPLPLHSDGPRVLLLARDVSQARARERAVVHAKDRAERLFEDAPHGVVILGVDGTVRQANAVMRAMTGPVEGGLLGKPLAVLGKPDDVRLDAHLAAVQHHRGGAQTEWTITGAHGTDVHVMLSSTVLSQPGTAPDEILVNVVDVSEQRRYERRLSHLADHDPLTGLMNRRRFDEELARHVERCDRSGAKGAVLLLDLDHFKDVNDTLGHQAGDQLLKSTAALLRSGLRVGDLVARLGGDEFAILLPEADRTGAEGVAASIIRRVRDYTASLEGACRRVTASIGVVTVLAAKEQVADILALADMTMYDAKDDGRNSYVVLDEGDTRQPRSGARLEWRGRIEAALESGSFAMLLQPILDLETNRVRSAEVLLRLDDTDELVSPAKFLSIAERCGLMPAIDALVVRESVAMLARLRELDPGFQLEVNLSGHSMGDPEIERVIVQALGEHDVDSRALILEVTETAAVADFALAREFAERMSLLGCSFALDDFGAGFGSFYYLKHLHFDYVKIDGEFVAACHTSVIDRSILRSIVQIARDLGKRTVAEFVTDEEVLEIVRAEGVDLAQGYLVGKPMAYDEFVATFLPAGAGAALRAVR